MTGIKLLKIMWMATAFCPALLQHWHKQEEIQLTVFWQAPLQLWHKQEKIKLSVSLLFHRSLALF